MDSAIRDLGIKKYDKLIDKQRRRLIAGRFSSPPELYSIFKFVAFKYHYNSTAWLPDLTLYYPKIFERNCRYVFAKNHIVLISERTEKFNDSPVHCVNVDSGQMVALCPLPIGLSYMSAVNFNDEIFICGGWCKPGTILQPTRSVFR